MIEYIIAIFVAIFIACAAFISRASGQLASSQDESLAKVAPSRPLSTLLPMPLPSSLSMPKKTRKIRKAIKWNENVQVNNSGVISIAALKD